MAHRLVQLRVQGHDFFNVSRAVHVLSSQSACLSRRQIYACPSRQRNVKLRSLLVQLLHVFDDIWGLSMCLFGEACGVQRRLNFAWMNAEGRNT